jgi:positive regulator of sigma E activity
MKWLEITTIILRDVSERLHRLHIWVLFPTLGVLIGAMIGVFVFSRSQSMVLGAFLGLLVGLRAANWYLKK